MHERFQYIVFQFSVHYVRQSCLPNQQTPVCCLCIGCCLKSSVAPSQEREMYVCACVQHLVCIIHKVALLGGVEYQYRLQHALFQAHTRIAFNKQITFKQNLSRLARN